MKLLKLAKQSIYPAIVLTGLVAVGLTGCRHSSPEGRADWVVGKITSDLDLTPPQKAKLELVKNEFLANRSEMVKKRQASFDTLIKQVGSDKLDQAVIKNLINEHRAQFDQKSDKMIALIADFHASLTPEQKVKAVEKLEKFHEKMAKHWE